MRSRALVVILAVLSLAAFSGAAFFIRVSEQRIASNRAAMRAFNAAARAAAADVAEFDADRTVTSLAALRSMATTEGARASIDQAAASVGDLAEIAPILERLDAARLAEEQAVDGVAAAERKLEAIGLAGAAAIALIAFATLAFAWPKRQTVENDAPMSTAPTESLPSTQPTSSAVLRAASELCTNFARMSDVDEFRRLIAQAAELMDANGLIVWMSAPGVTELRPAISHGYPDEMLSRLPPLSRSADNAAAAAFRTRQLQIVLARPGSSNGAVVAPLLTSAGCVGVISAEIRGGGETAESVQALAAIFAAQLANVLQPAPQTQENRATGTHDV
jgi:hypothetical protein